MFHLSGFAQKVIQGHIKERDGKPIENVNVVALNQIGDDIIAYAISNENGDFKLTIMSNKDSVRLEASCLGFEKIVKSINLKNSQYFSFVLIHSTRNLKEIIVRPQPIIVIGDTISYDAKLFSDRSDRVILDVIKKIPGIKVTENGQILYNNKPINKFYIEGKDLLEDRYNIATNNLPLEIVYQIQVLQNHQPIQLLNGIEKSDHAAINIKLNKDAKLRLIGNGHIGIGPVPLISDDKVSLMEFSKTLQYINTASYNNTGIDANQELNDQSFSTNPYETDRLQQDLVSLVKTPTPPIDQSRYWFNHNIVSSGNYLVGLNKLFDLKINASFEHDQIDDHSSAITNIYLPSNTIHINEVHTGVCTFSKLLMGLALQANTKIFYLKDAFKLQRLWSMSDDFIQSSGINQQLNNPFINLVNDAVGIINIDQNLIGINSYTSFSNQPQFLMITPGQYEGVLNNGQAYGGLLQNIQLRGFFTNSFATYSKKWEQYYFSDKAGVLVQIQNLTNKLSVDLNNNYQALNGDFSAVTDRKRLKIYNDMSLNLNADPISFSVGLKTSINGISNKNQRLDQNLDKIFLNPTLSFLYKHNAFWESSLTLLASNNLNTEGTGSYILKDYRTLVDNSIPIKQTSSKNIAYNLGYKNVIDAIYINFKIEYYKSISNILTSTNYDSVLLTRTAIVQNNPYTNLNLGWNINKYLLAIRTSFDLSLEYNQVKSKQMLAAKLVDFNSDLYTTRAKVNTRVLKSASLEYLLEFTEFCTKATITGQTLSYKPNDYLKNNLIFKYFFPNNVESNLSLSHYYNNDHIANPQYQLFTDLSLQKSNPKLKLDFSVSIKNIFNTTRYTSYSYVDNIFTSSVYRLPGRMMIFRVGFQF